ncbi:hypothetical protein PFY10_10450 [Chryseobacterium daecheongense]|nr:hypothetical protein PFY10_10450 [Chryseobacterium daecheongense]
MRRDNDILMPETDLNNKKLSIILKKDSMYGFLNPEAIINIFQVVTSPEVNLQIVTSTRILQTVLLNIRIR